ncbi:MAG: PAS domain S-box protein [Dehalococcoidia bacterium]
MAGSAALAAVRAALDAAATPLALLDGAGRYLHANAALAAWLGARADDLAGTEAAAHAAAAASAALHTRSEWSGSWTMAPEREASVTLRPVDGTNAVIVTVTPVTTAAPAEALDLIVDAASAGIALVDDDGRLVRVNTAWAEFAGLPASEIVGRTLWSGIPRAGREEARASILSTLAGDPAAPAIIETPVVRPDGTTRILAATARPYGPLGARYLVVTAIDVTAEREARAASETSERELRAMFAHTGAALALLDSEGRYVQVNPAWCELYGWTPDEVAGRHYLEHSPDPGDPTMQPALYADHLAKRDVRIRTLQRRRRDGSVLWVLSHTTVIEFGGRPYVLSTTQDITRLRADEALLDSIFETAAGGVALVDEEHRVVRVNRAGMEMVGWDASLTGQALREMIPEHALRRDGGEVRVLASAARVDLNGRPHLLLTTTDVTAQREAEEALRESEARHRLLVETLHEGIWMTNADGITTYANAHAAQIMGVAPEEMAGKPFSAVISKQDRRHGQPIGERRRTGVSEQYDFKIHRLDGETRWVMVSAAALKTAGGAFDGTIVSMVDITARKQQEEELARLAAIIESAGDIIIDRDLDGRITSWNHGAERAFGYTAAELVGSDGAVLAAGKNAPTQAAIERVLAGQTIRMEETPRRHRDGHTIYVSGTMFPRRDGEGQIAGVSSITRDVTAERAGREAMARMAAIVDASTDVIMTFGLDGRITDWNRSAERVLGYTAGEAIGQTMALIAPPGEPTRWPALFQRALRGERFGATGGRIESRRRAKDGRIVLFDVSIFPVRDASDAITGVVVTATDVTEQRRRQREVERLAAIVDSSTDAILLVGRDERILAWNRAAERHLGWPAAEAIGQPVSLIDVPGRERHYSALLERAFAGELTPDEMRLETERRAKDGSVHPFLVTLFPITENGEITAIGVIAREISDLRRQSEAMARLAAIVESANDAICGLALDGTVVSWNRKAEELFGYTAAEVIGRAPGQGTDFLQATFVERVRLGEAFSGVEAVRRTKDGSPIDVELAGFPVRDEAGATAGYALIARDIGERKRQQEAIERLASIVESSNDLVFTLSPAGRVTSWNHAAAEISGFSEAEMLGQPLAVFDRPDGDDPGLQPLFERALAGETVTGAVARRWRRNGEAIDVLLSTFPMRSADGGIAGVAIMARDITRQKHDERAREAAEARLRLVLQSTPLILFACDAEGKLVMVEGRGLAGLGIEPARLLGKSFLAALGSGGMSTEADAVRLALEGEVVTTTTEVRDTWLEVRYSPVRDAAGAVTGVAGVAIDVTQRRRSEQARREAEARAHTIAANAPVILWACDDHGEITYIEGMGLELMGLPRPRPGSNLLAIDEGGVLAGGLRRALAGEHVSHLVELRGRVLEGSVSPTRDDSGRVTGAVGVATDVTERRKADLALIQAQKMESLGVLAGGIAHDFNNLLVAVMGNADLALLRSDGDEEMQHMLTDIKSASRRAADLARQMLAYSGKGTFIIDRFEVEGLVREMGDLLRVSLGQGVQLAYDFAAPGAMIEGDGTQLRQVVMNLVINATEAIGDGGGAVTVKTAVVHAMRATFAGMYLSPDLPEGDYIEVRVTDTGRGMIAETASRIFDPFFTTKFTGRGLGLAAVLGIVRGHRGAISVTSAEGAGTTFTLLFPRA